MNHSFVLALSTLVGTIIGAGIFGLPYVVSESGIVPGLFYFLVLGGAVTLLHLFFGEVCLRTPEQHRLIGYSEKYLGKKAKVVATFSTILGIVGALLAYTIVGGEFLRIVVGSFVPLSNITLSLLFWALLSFFIFKGIQLIAKAELFMSIALIATVLLIFFFAAPHINIENISFLNVSNIFLPYGVVLFALAGWSAIPEIADFFKRSKEKRNLDNVIVVAGIVTILLYLFFSLFVVGVSGSNTSTDALKGLIPFLGEGIVMVGAIFGLIAIAASFLVLGNYLKNSLRYDLGFSYFAAALVATVTPIALFLLGFREFITVLGILGIIGSIDGLLIILLFLKARKNGKREPEYKLRIPRFLPYVLGFLLLGGAAAELFFTYGR